VTQKLTQIDTGNHATFPVKIRKIKVQICGNFWVTQYAVNKRGPVRWMRGAAYKLVSRL